MSADERREDVLARLRTVTAGAHWVVAADALHGAGTLLADLRRTLEAATVWGRLPAGRERTIVGFRRLHDRLVEVGFRGEILAELGETVQALERQPASGWRRVSAGDVVLEDRQEFRDDPVPAQRDVQPPIDVHGGLGLLECAR
jgi:hypothetical protein